MTKSARLLIAAATILIVSHTAFAQSDAQRAFDKLKTLAGTWEGAMPEGGGPVQITYRVTSGGSALLAETSPNEAMITVFHLDGDRLLMTHYCGAGNQPRMVGKLSPDGKSIVFDFIDATNLASPDAGHMRHAVITISDAAHHSEEWTYRNKGQEESHRFDLHRIATASAAPAPAKLEEHSH